MVIKVTPIVCRHTRFNMAWLWSWTDMAKQTNS